MMMLFASTFTQVNVLKKVMSLTLRFRSALDIQKSGDHYVKYTSGKIISMK